MVTVGIASRGSGTVDANGNVTLHKIFSYDIVADPSFKNAMMMDYAAELRKEEIEKKRKIRKEKLKKLYGE